VSDGDVLSISESEKQSLLMEEGKASATKSVRPPKRDRRKRVSIADASGATELFQWVWGGSKHSGLLCVALSCACYSLMEVPTRLFADHHVPHFQIAAMRCALIAVAAGLLLRKAGIPLLGSPDLRWLLLSRALGGFASLSAFFFSLEALGAADVTMITYLGPFFTAAMARVFLQEKLGYKETLGMALGFLGVLLMSQPPLFFHYGVLSNLKGANQVQEGFLRDGWDDPLALFVCLVAAISGASVLCTIRSLVKAGESPLVTVFAFSAFSAPAAACMLGLLRKFVVLGPWEVLGTCLVSMLALAAQALLARGLQLEKAARGTAILSLQVLLSSMLATVFFGERITLVGGAGAVLIVCSCAFVAATETLL
jgi:drug/metabolite transporter (DMT)-like permease